ncbi:MAG: glucoamylase family protein, partial [Pyrinomonadaceae bacterium]
FGERTRRGLADSVALMREEATRLGSIRQRTEVVTVKHLRDELDGCARLVANDAPETFSGWSKLLAALNKHALVLDDIVGALSHEHGADNFAELRFWLDALRRQTQNLARDLHTLAHESFMLAAQLTPLIKFCSAEHLARWEATARELDTPAAPSQMFERHRLTLLQINALREEIERSSTVDEAARVAALATLELLTRAIEEASEATGMLIARAGALAGDCQRIFDETDFKFLLDAERKVFVIGYNVSASRADNSYYDLLASESRLASFVAIAKGDVPQEHWFHLGRGLTPVDGGRALISWTATMFEYLMPLLVMRDYERTLLHETYTAIVGRQIEYGEERRVPWGISEAAYNARDLQLNYQYGPFGVPGLGLKRGLIEDLVVAPYATMLASLVEPRAALENIRRLEREGALARYGYYESIDYTAERLPQNQKRVLIRAFMAHHQGMSLVALDNLLNADVMQRRFHAEPLVQATELLLQERVPRGVAAAHPRAEEVLSGRVVHTLTGFVTRVYDAPNLPTPRTQLLSNGAYTVMVTTAGAGYSACRGLAVTRWREDVTRDNYGSFFYLRDVRSGAVWSAGYQPVGRSPKSYEVTFSEDKVDFWRSDTGIITHTEVIVSPEDDAEVRRISLTNGSSRVREIEVTSYSEVVLAAGATDAAHPAFSNLFIETEFIAAENALVARRRPRSAKDAPVYGIHVVVAEGERIGAIQ